MQLARAWLDTHAPVTVHAPLLHFATGMLGEAIEPAMQVASQLPPLAAEVQLKAPLGIVGGRELQRAATQA